MNEDKQDLTKLLQSDSKKIRETEDFDPKLHQDTLREIRLIASADRRERGFIWSPLKVFATAAVAVIAFVLVFPSGEHSTQPEVNRGTKITLVVEPSSGSAAAYREALAEGEDALLAMLDRDASVILPRSASMFHSNR